MLVSTTGSRNCGLVASSVFVSALCAEAVALGHASAIKTARAPNVSRLYRRLAWRVSRNLHTKGPNPRQGYRWRRSDPPPRGSTQYRRARRSDLPSAALARRHPGGGNGVMPRFLLSSITV